MSARDLNPKKQAGVPMEKKPLEVYSQASNAAMVRMPGRAFPGLVLQGDTLSILRDMASSVAARTQDEEAAELSRQLDGMLRFYELVMVENGLPLPYSSERK